jgi:hypothetical protein
VKAARNRLMHKDHHHPRHEVSFFKILSILIQDENLVTML